MDLALTEKNTVEKTYSNAKRFSFLLWPGEKVKTPQQQLKNPITNLTDLKSRFSVEVVRKQFFDDYIDLFIRLYIQVSEDRKLVEVLHNQKIDLVKFTKNLLGKIIFIYFIQKKWWLWVEKWWEWWTGNKNFMRWVWDNRSNITFEKTGNFYNDCLEHLFYNGFNSPARLHDDDYDLNFKCRIPYLNWWLFKSDYDFEQFTSHISNDIFSNDKDGILDIFDTYNFTIDEDDQTDAEIAVDPEMLWKIFEKMISVSHGNIDEILVLYKEKWKIKIGTELNKKFGAFYTPREIVHYMTRESLIAYLWTNLTGKWEDNEIKIRTLIESKDQHRSRQELEDSSPIASIASEVDLLLQKVKIIDPAVGSWAFPMGILHEISTLRYYLHSEGFCTVHSDHSEEEWDTTELTIDGYLSMYQIKRETIKNSIYGVDIESGAIDIARLRFWLSLVVDAKHPEPLPNFEFKFVCANTLIPLDDDTEKKQMTFGMLEEASLKTIKRYKREYYNADTKSEKARIATKLREYTKLPALRLGDIVPKRSLQVDEFGKNFDNSNHSHSFFDASLMLSEWRGFDIVIGNPPYITFALGKQQNFSDALIDSYKKLYPLSAAYKVNSYLIFTEKWLNLINANWFLSFIVPNSIYTNYFYSNFRKYLIDNFSINIMLNLDYEVFEDANIGGLSVFIIWKWNSQKMKLINIWSTKEFSAMNWFQINKSEFSKIPDYKFLFSKSKILLWDKAFQGSTTLNHECFQFYNWIKTWDNAKFLSEKKIDHRYRPVIRWRDFYKYSSLENKLFVLFDKEQLWSNTNELMYNVWEKLIIRQTSDHLVATYDDGQHFTMDTTHILFDKSGSFNHKYLLALLNSRLLNFLYQIIVPEVWKAFSEVKIVNLKKIPIKAISLDSQQDFISLIDQILDAKKLDPKADTSDFEMRIDDLVYELYGLTEGEIAVVEGK
jgi:hypothetical protein